MPLTSPDGRDPVLFLAQWAAAAAAALNAQLPHGEERFVTETVSATRSQGAEAVAAPALAPVAPTHLAPARFTDHVGVNVVDTANGRRVAAAVLFVTPDNKADSDSALAFAVRAAGLMSGGAGVVVVDPLPGPASWATHLHSLTGVYPITRRPRGADAPVLAVQPTVQDGAEQFAVWHHNVAPGGALPAVPVAVRGAAPLTLDLELTHAEAHERNRPA